MFFQEDNLKINFNNHVLNYLKTIKDRQNINSLIRYTYKKFNRVT